LAESLGFWCVSGNTLLEMLRRCAAGEDPDLIYAEYYANCDVDIVDPDEE
jgi:hypothetical protein